MNSSISFEYCFVVFCWDGTKYLHVFLKQTEASAAFAFLWNVRRFFIGVPSEICLIKHRIQDTNSPRSLKMPTFHARIQHINNEELYIKINNMSTQYASIIPKMIWNLLFCHQMNQLLSIISTICVVLHLLHNHFNGFWYRIM